MAGFLVISDQTIADFSNRPKLEDDSFDGDGKYSDVYAKSTSCLKVLPCKICVQRIRRNRDCLNRELRERKRKQRKRIENIRTWSWRSASLLV